MSKQDVLTINKDDVVLSPFPHCFKHPFVRPDLFSRLKEEFPKDPFATLETINSSYSRDISDMLKEENVENKVSDD